jgi:hypothetical protein
MSNIGQKLGGIFGAVGSGISMIPGIGTAIGAGLSAVGGLAGMAGDIRARKEMQEEEEQLTEASTPAEPLQNNSRPGQKQIDPVNPQMRQPSQPNVFNPQRQVTGLGGYQGQLDQAIANLITGGDRNPLGGP